MKIKICKNVYKLFFNLDFQASLSAAAQRCPWLIKTERRRALAVKNIINRSLTPKIKTHFPIINLNELKAAVL